MPRLTAFGIPILIALAASLFLLDISGTQAQEPDDESDTLRRIEESPLLDKSSEASASSAELREFGIDLVDNAIASGKLDISVVEQLVDNGSAEAIIILNQDDTIAIGQELRVSKNIAFNDKEILGVISEIVADKQNQVIKASGSDVAVLKNYRNVPSQHVLFESIDGLIAYIANPDVVGIRENQLDELLLTESLPLINQPAVESSGITGQGTAVAVLDTGVDYTHPDFGSCSQPGEPGCKVLFSADTGVADDGSPDDDGHGSNVAGIVVGVAPDTGIVMHDVFVQTPEGFGAPVSAQMEAIDRIISDRDTYNIVSINISIGGSPQPNHCTGDPRLDSFAAARLAGISVVAATGNDFAARISSPACVPGAVSVGATYDANRSGSITYNSTCTDLTIVVDRIACFSNTSYFLSALAPGAFITAGGQINFSGTSMATPHVAGAVAVLRQNSPTATVHDIEEAIVACGPVITDHLGGAESLKFHRLDLLASVNHLNGTRCASGPGPANDHINAATVISTPTFTDTLDVTDATNEPSDPIVGCAIFDSTGLPTPHGKTVWYQIDPISNGTIELASTNGSDYDTTISIWTGQPGNLTNVACNDDADFPIDTTSILTNIPVTQGTTYYIEVSGWAGDSGNLNLSVVADIFEPEANLNIQITDSPDPAVVGDDLTYSVTVTNLGPDTANNVQMTSSLPEQVTYKSDSPSQGSCGVSESLVTCNLGAITDGSNATVDIVVTPNTVGQITNLVSVSADENDSIPSNNQATAETTVEKRVDLSVSKQGSPDPVVAGETLTYSLTVRNGGPSPATNIVVEDELPIGVGFFSSEGCTAVDRAVTCEIDSLNSGQEVDLTVEVEVSVALEDASTLTNTAEVSSDEPDTDLENNSSTVSVLAVPRICGDQNFDGKVDIRDTVVDLNLLANQLTPLEAQIILSDFDGDGNITLADISILMRHLVSKILELNQCD